jgi:hypothetical protein
LCFRRVVRQPEPLTGEGIDPIGGGAAERPAAVTAQLTETEVVDVEEQDIRPAGHAQPSFSSPATCPISMPVF